MPRTTGARSSEAAPAPPPAEPTGAIPSAQAPAPAASTRRTRRPPDDALPDEQRSDDARARRRGPSHFLLDRAPETRCLNHSL